MVQFTCEYVSSVHNDSLLKLDNWSTFTDHHLARYDVCLHLFWNTSLFFLHVLELSKDMFLSSHVYGMLSDKLKVFKVVPNHKKDDKQNIENYRPISLLPSIPKIMRKLFIVE